MTKTAVMPARAVALLVGLLIAFSGVNAARAATAQPLAPVPNCFTSNYAYTSWVGNTSVQGVVQYRVGVQYLPLTGGATVYITFPSGTTQTKSVPNGSRSGSWGPYNGPTGAGVRVSIYQGSYQVCSGSGTVPGNGLTRVGSE